MSENLSRNMRDQEPATMDDVQFYRERGFSVREWCRLGRVRAEKRPCGRGNSKEWMISHQELLRIKSEGLLPLREYS